jgi:hypothetical protein
MAPLDTTTVARALSSNSAISEASRAISAVSLDSELDPIFTTMRRARASSARSDMAR